MTDHRSVTRRFRMRRVRTGDYLLWSNDAKVLWRIVRYIEGKSAGLVDAQRDWTEWAAYRWDRGASPASEDDLDLDRWREVATAFRSRQEAIDYALSYQPAPLPADPRPRPSVQDAIQAMVRHA